MMAPCGIELKVGQKWILFGLLYEVIGFHGEKVVLETRHKRTFDESLDNFTQNPGGYYLASRAPE